MTSVPDLLANPLAQAFGSNGAPPLRVLIVDDAPSTRRFLDFVLSRVTTFEVVAEADSGQTAIAAAERLLPDVILLDLSLPDTDGAHVLPELLRVAPGAKVVVLSNNAKLAAPRLADAGAVGFIEKGLPPRELLKRLSDVLGIVAPHDFAAGEVAAPHLPLLMRCAVVCDANPGTRRQISSVLDQCGLQVVSEVLATEDVVRTVQRAVAMTQAALVIVGDLAEGGSSTQTALRLQHQSPDSSFIAYTTEPTSGRTSTADKIQIVRQPEIERLEGAVRQVLAGPANQGRPHR